MNQIYSDWKELSKRILAFLKVIEFSYQSFNKHLDGDREANDEIINNGVSIYNDLIFFCKKYREGIPIIVAEKINNEKLKIIFSEPSSDGPALKVKRVAKMAIFLRLLECETSYFFTDQQRYLHKSVEISFSHLQRIIEVDKVVQEKWSAAANYETDVEKLGALHLLSHKIYAFKSDALGQKTDLIFQELSVAEKLEKEINNLRDCVEGLVLTEWKIANEINLEKKVAEAKEQAEIYSTESLAPLELRDYRYLIIVSETHLKIPEHLRLFKENEINYRVINIAYKPQCPSKRSRKNSKKT